MSIEYKKNEDGTFAMWSCGQPKLAKDALSVQKAQFATNLDALTEIEGLSKDAARVVSQIVQQQSDLMKKPDFTWAEIVAKFKKPYQEQITAIEKALATVIEEPK